MQPLEIKVHRKSALLELRYAADTFQLSAEYLRVHSPSAEVQGHGPGQSVLQTGKKLVSFKDIIPQGHYAIRIEFSDGHDSGIFSWEYLFDLAVARGATTGRPTLTDCAPPTRPVSLCLLRSTNPGRFLGCTMD